MRTLRAASLFSIALATTACVDGGDFPMFQSKATEGTEDVATRRATRLIERDIEAPEVFQVTEAGLWDGRPSLGGVWVAHPDVTEPERVLIRNTANDKFVIGALFRRERENPGPRLQVSSDAAAALGMLAGAPQNLNVTALRRQEVQQTAEAEAPEAPDEEVAGDPIQAAARAIDTAEGATTETVAAAASTAAPLTEAAVEAAPAAAPDTGKKSGFFSRLFKKKDKPAPAMEATALDAPQVETTALTAPEVATAPLDAMRTAPAQHVAAQTVAATAAPRPAASNLSKPYLQIGIFSVEENAQNTATAMRQQGMIPTVRKQSSQGKEFWRVLIGPATTATERAQLLDKVKASGFTDAYAVTN
ncbi:SPOR domain-containing protein [Pseudooceanicola sp. LIPI14-2-Ac024]|uniref:SPOR domain-containing protein n=1 Tax=Pseudooceanicola sp. LIPI14-2-Ac024 TaxID=3344875 RepID=UPI0035CFB4F7